MALEEDMNVNLDEHKMDSNISASNSNSNLQINTSGKMFTLKKWNAVAMWSWDVVSDTCAICRVIVMDACLRCQAENKPDECVVVWGECNHSFHNCCMALWVQQNNRCPLCQQEWRYFEEANSFKPGEISDNLRNAIGISRKNLPFWIYRMRILGYPPGWLKKADMTNTTIKLFDGFEKEHDDKIQYNTDSFFEYPGFNIPPPKNVKDDCERLGMPPMMPFQQLKFAKRTIHTLKPVPYKRLKLSNDLEIEKNENSTDDASSNDEKNKNTNNNSNFLEKNKEKKQKIKKIKDDFVKITTVSDSSSIEKINLDEQNSFNTNENNIFINNSSFVNKNSETIKEQKFFIDLDNNMDLKKVNKEEDEESVILLDNSEERINLNLEKNKVDSEKCLKINSVFELSMSNSESVNLIDDLKDTDEKFQNQNSPEMQKQSSKVTLISMGAPVPASLNGEKPPLENFAVGMGELIYFENLPTSTGVFDKMRKVIKKIRKKLS